MRCLVKAPWMYAIFVLKEIPPGRDALEREGMEVVEGGWVEIPEDIVDWPDGFDPPPPTLGVSKADPRRHRLFKRPEELQASGFEPTGMSFGGVYTPEMWGRLVEDIPSLKAFHAIGGNDPPGAMDEAMRYIREAR